MLPKSVKVLGNFSAFRFLHFSGNFMYFHGNIIVDIFGNSQTPEEHCLDCLINSSVLKATITIREMMFSDSKSSLLR